MPGIADLQPVQIQANSLGALDAQPDVNVSSLGALPEFQDFMNAYKQGVITADDIRKRQTIGNTGNEAERDTNLARSAQAKQATLEASDIQPRERALKREQLAGATTQQTLLNQLSDPDPEVALPAQEAFMNRQRQIASVKVFGTATPKLEVNAGAEPPEFNEWATRQVNNFEGTDQARAAYETNLRLKGEKGEEYSTAVKAAKSRTRELTPGTPEYEHELRTRTDQALTHEQLQAIQLDTLKEFGKAQATASGKAAGGEGKAEAVDRLAKEYNSLPALHDFDKVDAAYNKLVAATDASAKPTPLRDQAAIFSWMKILDPGSTVREGEYASVKNAKGVPDKVLNFYNQTLTGQLLTPEQRTELREAAEPVFQGQVQNLSPRIKQYLAREKAAGLTPGSVVPLEHRALLEEGGPATAPAAQSAAPTARPTVEQASSAPTFQSPAQVPNTVQFFKSPDGKLRVNPAYRP